MSFSSEKILITGAAGFIGTELASALLRHLPTCTLILIDTTQPPVPPNTPETAKVFTHALDLTEPTLSHPQLLAVPLTCAYLLHGIMSAGSEKDLDLSLAVNLDSHRNLLDSLRTHHEGLMVIFPSSIAALGPVVEKDEMVTERTPALPQSTYGTHKLMIESLLSDYSRRGLLDGRIVRLPTVIVRPGAPSAAASSFASGIARESLRGVRNVCPVRKETEMWICSPRVVVENLVMTRRVNKLSLEGRGRVVNLPGRTVRVGDILDVVEKVGGWDARGRIVEEIDEETQRIVSSWPAWVDTSYAEDLGFYEDVGLEENVRAFAESVGK